MHMSYRIDVCERLTLARKARGFKSAKSFAEHHKIPASTYQQHESASRKMHIDSVITYCDLLQISPNWLLLEEGFASQDPSFNEKLVKLTMQTYHYECKVPFYNESKICEIDTELLHYILGSILEAIKLEKIDLPIKNTLVYVTSLYNNVITSNDKKARTKLIGVAIESLIQGNRQQTPSDKKDAV